MVKFLNKVFKLEENGTTVMTEVVAGIVTFMSMVYILMVNADMFTAILPDDDLAGKAAMYNAVYIATALSAVVGTVLIGLLAKLPLAQASGMGLNAFFVYTICGMNGLTYANALVFVLIDGVVFVLLTLTGLRKMIFNAIPDCVKTAIPAGIGLFIAFIGLQNAGIVVLNKDTKVQLVSMNFLANATWGDVMPILVTLLGVFAIAALSKKKVKGAVLWGMLGTTVLYYLLGATVPEFYKGFSDMFKMDIIQPFKDWGSMSVGKVFTEGFNFSAYLEKNGVGSLILIIITGAFSFCMVDMFDTMGTLYGACARGNMLDENGEVPNMNRAMMSDAIATVAGAVCGTSTVTTFVESSAGVAEGGKTGLTSIVVAIGFLLAMFLTPIAKLIPTYATAAALIYVGVLMMNCVIKIDWLDPAIAVPAFITIAMSSFTYSISDGIGLGLIAYVLIQLFTGKFLKNEDGSKKLSDIMTLVIAVLFLAMFFLSK